MSKLQTLAFAVLTTASLPAEVVLWTANGTLGSGTGLFSRDDLLPDDPITIRVTYNDQATPDIRGQAVGRTEIDYRTDINLTVTISTDDYTWQGFVESASGLSPTTFVTVTNTFPLIESVDITVLSSLNIIFEADEVVAPIAPVLSLATTSTSAFLSWQSDFRFRYQVESTPSLASPVWTPIETRFGTDATITRSYPLTADTLFYRVIALPREIP